MCISITVGFAVRSYKSRIISYR